MTFRDKALAVCTRYMSKEASEVAAALLAAFKTAEDVAGGKRTDAEAMAVVQMLVDLTFTLPLNTFWQQHAGRILPVYMTAVNAWLDAGTYATAAKADPASAVKFVAGRQQIVEVAVVLLLVDKGAVAMREDSRKLRDDLVELRG